MERDDWQGIALDKLFVGEKLPLAKHKYMPDPDALCHFGSFGELFWSHGGGDYGVEKVILPWNDGAFRLRAVPFLLAGRRRPSFDVESPCIGGGPRCWAEFGLWVI